MKTIFRLLTLSLLVFSASAFSADRISIYKEKFIASFPELFGEQMKPMLEKKGLSSDEVTSTLNIMAQKMAECQVKLLSTYEKRYSDIAYNHVQSGGGITDATRKVNAQIEKDLASGAITEEKLSEQINNAVAIYETCMDKIAADLNL